MQVSVEKTSELSRKMTVSLPEEMVEEKMDARFKSLARDVKIDGFRPGKVPVRVVKKMYGDKVRGEVLGDLIQKTCTEALQQQSLNPASPPHIHQTDETVGFGYIAEFEVYPEVSLEGISSLEIKRPLATIEQADREAMVAKLREQKKQWNVVERAALKGDQVTVHFTGVCDGENFTDGKVENSVIEIGSNKMIPGFEDALTGLEVGANKTFEITFPEDYGNKKLAGKMAEFEVEMNKIEESFVPEIDEEFIKAYGIEDGTMDSFNKDLQFNMERELARGLKEKLKMAVLDELYEKMPISVPKALIDQEVQNIIKPYQDNAKKQQMKLEDLDLPIDAFEAQAKRRVAMGLVLAEIIKKNGIKVDDAKVRSFIEGMANSYEQPEEVINWYYTDENRLNEVKQMVLEEQTVEWIVGQAQMSDEMVSFEQVMEKQA